MPAQLATSAAKARDAAAARRRAASQRSATAPRAQRPKPALPVTPASTAYPSSTALTDSLTSLFGNDTVTEETLDALCDLVETDSQALGASSNNVRALCRNRRQQLASQGKAAAPRKPGTASRLSGRNPRSNQGLQGRDAARQRRNVMARNGRGDVVEAPRPSGRIRPARVPPKVETDATLSGSTVTGTPVSRVSQAAITGGESGACRAVTGTEYLGADHFDTLCGTRPEPNKPKVGVTVTSGGLAVSGTEIGRSQRVTGDEQGSCRPVTGTEYLGLEQFADFCENKGLTTRAPKVVAGTTERKKITVTGVDEARLQPVTGNQSGASLSITGSQYADAGASRMTINGPQKVALTHTIAGRSVTGTEVGRAINVTGDEHGSCRPVTGTEYVSSEQFKSICKTQAPARSAKVGEDSSRNGQRITGNLVNRTEKVTGNEATATGKVTGSQYGDSKVAQRTAAPKAYPMRALAMRHALQAAPEPIIVPEPEPMPALHEHAHPHDANGLCCDECAAEHQVKVAVAQVRGMLPPPPVMCHGCADAAVAALKQAQMTSPSANQTFSAPTPAPTETRRITGNADDGLRRITGPGNRAARLVSGTPEFRYQHPAAMPEPAAPTPPTVDTGEISSPVSRITGDGRDGGTRITGDDWGRSGRMTGTEGQWANGRNPTLRGTPRSMAMVNAHANKALERPEAPPLAKVTGSSGNSGKGALITVSGGARG